MSAPAARRPIDVLRNLPQNIDAEKSFLGSVFLDNSVLDQEILTPENLHLQFHQQIHKTMLEMWGDRNGKSGDRSGGRKAGIPRRTLLDCPPTPPTPSTMPTNSLKEVALSRRAVLMPIDFSTRRSKE